MNSIQIAFIESRRVLASVPDKRYRILVTLVRSDRPRYWKFSCIDDDCNAPIVELQNMDVVGLDDFYDPQNTANTGIGRHCKGTLRTTGLACQYSYFFHVR